MSCKNHGLPREETISREELEKLPEYSCSVPTGTTVGKRWRCDTHFNEVRNLDEAVFWGKRGGKKYDEKKIEAMREQLRAVEPEWQIAEYVDCACLDEDRIGMAWTWAIDPETGSVHRGELR